MSNTSRIDGWLRFITIAQEGFMRDTRLHRTGKRKKTEQWQAKLSHIGDYEE